MNTVRLNITLPSDIAADLDSMIGARRKSRFIAEAIRYRLEQIRHQQLQKDLAEGYQASSQEGMALASEFEIVDLDG